MHFYCICCHTRGYPKPRIPETRPKSTGAGAEMYPQVCLQAGFFSNPRVCLRRVFAKPAPASAGAIPSVTFPTAMRQPSLEFKHGPYLAQHFGLLVDRELGW